MTDWFAAGSTAPAASAGTGLQMPGPDRFFGAPLAAAVESGEVGPEVLAAAARRWVGLVDSLAAWDDVPLPERSVELPEHREVAHRAACAGTVLLRNDGTLPLVGPLARTGTLALIGPLASRPSLMGGGSAQLKPHRAALAAGGPGNRRTANACASSAAATSTAPSVRCSLPGCSSSSPVRRGRVAAHEQLAQRDLQQLWFGSPSPGLDEDDFSYRLTATVPVLDTGEHVLTLVQAGRARVLLDGVLVLDGITDPPPGGQELFGLGSTEISAVVDLTAGSTVTVVVEWTSTGSVMLHGAEGRPAPSPGRP